MKKQPASSPANCNDMIQIMRIFIGVAIPQPVRDSLSLMVESFRKEFSMEMGSSPEKSAPIRWIPASSWHLTLKFLGETSPEKADRVREALGRLAAERTAFEISLVSAGVFPNPKRPQIFWIGVDDPAGALRKVAEDIDIQTNSLGYLRETRAFVPHLTIGRWDIKKRGDGPRTKASSMKEPVQFKLSGESAARKFCGMLGTFESSLFEVKEFHLYQSFISSSGSIYEILDTFQLKD